MTKPTTVDQQIEIEKRYLGGETGKQIAPAFGLSEPGILAILKRRGVPRRNLHSTSPLSPEQERVICKRYRGGESSGEIAPNFGLVSATVIKVLKRNGAAVRSTSEANRRYPIQNEDFFDEVDTEAKAYFLGLLYADGFNNTEIGYVELSLVERDRDVVESFRDVFQPTRPLQQLKRKTPKHQNMVRYTLNSRRVSDRLAELGCMKAKTFKTTFPGWLQEDLVRHFIRGYADGDGYLGLRFLEHTKAPQVEFSLVGTLDFCEGVCSKLEGYCGLDLSAAIATRHPERNHNIRSLRVNNRNAVARVITFLYYGATVYMQRKYTKHLEMSKEILLWQDL